MFVLLLRRGMKSLLVCWLVCLFFLGVLSCGDDEVSIYRFLPEVPSPTGEVQSTWAGVVTEDSELIPGPAAWGRTGDFFIGNSKVRFIVASTERIVGVIPQGGNVVDVALLNDDGSYATEDHFGELGFLYKLGRTCEHDRVEVLQDGGNGGASVLRAYGNTANNDFLNLRGMGLIFVAADQDPDIDDNVECATTYILQPEASQLEVTWTLFNRGEDIIRSPFGILNDTGGETGVWSPGKGFASVGIADLLSQSGAEPIPFISMQGPNVAYSILPKHISPSVPNAQLTITGVSLTLLEANNIFDLVNRDSFPLDMRPGDGTNVSIDLVVGSDVSSGVQVFHELHSQETVTLDGSVSLSDGTASQAARIAVFRDTGASAGVFDPEDPVVVFADTDEQGRYSVAVPPGTYWVQAALEDQGKSPVEIVELTTSISNRNFTIPAPARVDFTITDSSTGQDIPGRIDVVGDHMASADIRVYSAFDKLSHGLATRFSVFGRSIDVGAGADEPIWLPQNGAFRVYFSRGTEWSVVHEAINVVDDTTQTIDVSLTRVVDTPNYLASEYHVHQIGSPDSPISNNIRVLSAVASGIEFFSTSDHDYITDLQPVIEQLDLAQYTRSIAGLEVTPFAYGHFNGLPIDIDTSKTERRGGRLGKGPHRIGTHSRRNL